MFKATIFITYGGSFAEIDHVAATNTERHGDEFHARLVSDHVTYLREAAHRGVAVTFIGAESDVWDCVHRTESAVEDRATLPKSRVEAIANFLAFGYRRFG